MDCGNTNGIAWQLTRVFFNAGCLLGVTRWNINHRPFPCCIPRQIRLKKFTYKLLQEARWSKIWFTRQHDSQFQPGRHRADDGPVSSGFTPAIAPDRWGEAEWIRATFCLLVLTKILFPGVVLKNQEGIYLKPAVFVHERKEDLSCGADGVKNVRAEQSSCVQNISEREVAAFWKTWFGQTSCVVGNWIKQWWHCVYKYMSWLCFIVKVQCVRLGNI